MGLRKIFMTEIISAKSTTGRILYIACEAIEMSIFLIATIFFLPNAIAAMALLGLGIAIVIRRKVYSYRIVQGRSAVLIGSLYLLAGIAVAAYTMSQT